MKRVSTYWRLGQHNCGRLVASQPAGGRSVPRMCGRLGNLPAPGDPSPSVPRMCGGLVSEECVLGTPGLSVPRMCGRLVRDGGSTTYRSDRSHVCVEGWVYGDPDRVLLESVPRMCGRLAEATRGYAGVGPTYVWKVGRLRIPESQHPNRSHVCVEGWGPNLGV